MLTCLASESTSPTFGTFPPQVLSTGERGGCGFPVLSLAGSCCCCCSLSCHPCSSPTGFPNTHSTLVQLENTNIPLVQQRHPHPPGPAGTPTSPWSSWKHPHPPGPAQSPTSPWSIPDTHIPGLLLWHQPGRGDSMWEQRPGLTHINVVLPPQIPARVSQEL